MHNKKYFCYEIYKNLSIISRNGDIKYNPCSYYKGNFKTDNTIDVDTGWNCQGRQALKSAVENDIPIEGCKSCYVEESHGLTSRRMNSKILYEEYHKDNNINIDSPQGIDYSVGNLCNLKCVICGPEHSSQWIPDYQKLNPTANIEFFKYKKFDQVEISNPASLKNIKSIHFHGGGEPLLSENHVRLLQKINEVKGLGDVRVFYNTNGTVTVSDEVLKIWEQCQLVELYFSIDDIGKRFDYQRTGANWSKVEQNLDWFYKNMPPNHMFKVNCCWSYLNLFYLDELYSWWDLNFKTNRCGDYVNLIFQKVNGDYSINYLSQPSIRVLKEKFKDNNELLSLVNTLKVSDRPHEMFWENITKLDGIRNSDFKSIHPEWSQLLS